MEKVLSIVPGTDGDINIYIYYTVIEVWRTDFFFFFKYLIQSFSVQIRLFDLKQLEKKLKTKQFENFVVLV